jgi:hypothetical membrane protein
MGCVPPLRVPWPRPAHWPSPALAGGRWLAGGGIAGPALFTAAWLIGSLRQTGYSAAEVQLSGLAALNARDPQIMIAGFVGLGVCSVAFGAALDQLPEAGSVGPWLVKTAGVAAVAAGLFRRDHLLLTGPGWAGESWHNQAHDLVSGVAYVAMIVAPLVLAWRLRQDPDWVAVSRLVGALTVISAVAIVLFASRVAGPWNAAVQRAAISGPLAAEMLMAARMLSLRRA